MIKRINVDDFNIGFEFTGGRGMPKRDDRGFGSRGGMGRMGGSQNSGGMNRSMNRNDNMVGDRRDDKSMDRQRDLGKRSKFSDGAGKT